MRLVVPRSALASALAALVALGSGCYAETSTTVPTSAEVYDGDYVPVYYDGYPVYYDATGKPYYYSNNTVIWIAPSSPYYPGLVHHWHVYGPAYGRWYGSHGYRYHGYRAAPGYYGHGHPAPAYHGAYHGGGAYHHGGAYHGGAYHGGHH